MKKVHTLVSFSIKQITVEDGVVIDKKKVFDVSGKLDKSVIAIINDKMKEVK